MRKAQNWVQNNANRCRMEHSSGGIGENLYCASPSFEDGRKPVKSWYNEIDYYNFNRPGFNSETGNKDANYYVCMTRI